MYVPYRLKKTLYRWYRNWWVFGWYRQFWYWAIFKKKNTEGKFIIIYCSSRTGSTLLSDSLAQSKDVVYVEELLRRPIFHYKSFLLGWSLQNARKWTIVKVKPMHLNRMGLSFAELHQFLQQHQVFTVHLWRENHFNRIVSLELAHKRQLFSASSNQAPSANAKWHLDPDNLIEKVKEDRLNGEKRQTALKNIQHMELVYEKHLQDATSRAHTISIISQKLGIELPETESQLQKVINQPLPQLIANWPDIEKAMHENGLGQYLPK